MGLFSWWKKRNGFSPEERRRHLLETGRIAEGTVMDVETTTDGDALMYFTYCVQGVDFESADMLTADQVAQPAKYAPGATVNVRYNTKNYGDSVVE